MKGIITQEDYAQQLIDEYRRAGVSAKNVYAQSFRLDDVLYWINNAPDFGKQAIFLDDASFADDLDLSLIAMENLARPRA